MSTCTTSGAYSVPGCQRKSWPSSLTECQRQGSRTGAVISHPGSSLFEPLGERGPGLPLLFVLFDTRRQGFQLPPK